MGKQLVRKFLGQKITKKINYYYFLGGGGGGVTETLDPRDVP